MWQLGGGLLIDGTATLTDTNVYANQADDVCSPFELPSSAPACYACSCGWQGGGGLYIGGTATLTNTNVYANQAAGVCSHNELTLTFIHRPAGTLRVLVVGRVAGESSSGAQQR